VAEPCIFRRVLPLLGVLAVTIAQLIQLATNRMAYLNTQRSLAVDRGDAVELAFIDNEISATELTLTKLNSLEG